MRLSTRSSVDLPQPEGPMNAVTLPSLSGSDTDFSAFGALGAVEEIEVLHHDLVSQARAGRAASACAVDEFMFITCSGIQQRS